MRFHATTILLTTLLTFQFPTVSEQLFVITEGANAQRYATGAYLHMVDTYNATVSDGFAISESAYSGDWTFSRDESSFIGTGLLRSTRQSHNSSDIRYPILIDLKSPFPRTLQAYHEHKLVAAIPAHSDKPDTTIIGLIYKTTDRGLLAYSAGNRTINVPLSMDPVAAFPGYKSESIIVVGRDSSTGAFSLQWCDTVGSRSIHRAKTAGVSSEYFEATLDQYTVTPDGRSLILGFSGYQLSEATGDRSAWLEVWDIEDREFVTRSDTFEGTWSTDSRAIIANKRGDIWTLTNTSGRGFAYVTRLSLADDNFVVTKLLPFSGVHETPRFALSNAPNRMDHLAVVINRNILLHDDALTRYENISIGTPLTALTWIEDALVAGMGNLLLEFNEHWQPRAAAEFHTGIVRDILLAPDSLDPTLSNSIQQAVRIPRHIEFDESRIGVESYTVPADVSASLISKPNWIQLNKIDANHTSVSVALRYDLTGPDAYGDIVFGSTNQNFETRITVSVHSNRDAETRLLWVRNPLAIQQSILSDSSPFATLIKHLSRYPWTMQHDELSAARTIDLDRYQALIFTSSMAAHGVLTRQEILDYLTRGGSVYYFASKYPGESGLQAPRWLEAVGMQIDTTTSIQGSFEATRQYELLRHWNNARINGGTRLQTVDPRARIIPIEADDEGAIVATGTYGLGRVIALASSTPIENIALQDGHGLRLAETLFASMRDATSTREDADLDGIPDYVEDRNGNGIQDAGETDFLEADSDHDGILDGLEDFNQNGFVDELETHPLLADTDADGIPDPADGQPLPPTGTPYIASVEPNVMPAEGGRPIIITGRNFTPDSQIWFGSIQTPEFRVLNQAQVEAIVPPQSESASGKIALRIVNGENENTAELPDGFSYTAASSAALTLRSVRTAREVYGIYNVQTQAFVDPTDVAMNLVKMVLEINPYEAVKDLEIIPAQELDGSLITRPVAPGRILILVSTVPASAQAAPLFTIRFQANMLEAQTPQLQLKLLDKVVRSSYGGLLNTNDKTELVYNFASTFQPFIE